MIRPSHWCTWHVILTYDLGSCVHTSCASNALTPPLTIAPCCHRGPRSPKSDSSVRTLLPSANYHRKKEMRRAARHEAASLYSNFIGTVAHGTLLCILLLQPFGQPLGSLLILCSSRIITCWQSGRSSWRPRRLCCILRKALDRRERTESYYAAIGCGAVGTCSSFARVLTAASWREALLDFESCVR
jgi:hypothetical protein